MNAVHGFELLREQELPDVNSLARLYRHRKTGAELLSLINNDENKVFGVTFRTPPTDSTGVAHILEHSVLCGSRKYPVKDPFVQMLKGSLQTFLNAMTYPDKTVYPVASQNLTDFYNLVDVYLDAVFHPRINEDIFRQEGWHYELDPADRSLTFKGIVFNEMKGAYSSPESLLNRYSQQSLFPDTTYGVDSGGDPKEIPDLTHAQLKAFHSQNYHPSNARLFFHGDDDPNDRLRLLDAYFQAFEPSASDTSVPLQARFNEPRRLMRTYVVSKEDERPKTAMAAVNWMLDEIRDVEADLALTILDRILIGTPAAPLRKALIDSGLGEAPVGGGLSDDLRQETFSIGLKGIDPADREKVEALVLSTLRALASDGIPQTTVEAAMNTVEFVLREQNTGSLPRGISLMLWSMRSWLYGGDPLAPLSFKTPLEAIKSRVASGERYFEALIERSFLDNAHRTTLLLKPDREQGEREAAEEKQRLSAARAAMSEIDLTAVAEAEKKLKLLQETSDPPEALATIPTLKLQDLPRENKSIPRDVSELQKTLLLRHDLPTNGIVYLDLGFDLRGLPKTLLPYVTLFGRALLQTGAGDEDFVQLSERIGRLTGGIRPQRWAAAITGTETSAAWLFLQGKALTARTSDLLAILRDVLTGARLDNRERIRQLVHESKAGLETAVAPGSSRFVDLRLRAGLHETGWLAEHAGGVSYLFFLRALAEQIDSDWASVQASLERIRKFLVNRSGMVCNVTASADDLTAIEPWLDEFLAGLPHAHVERAAWRREAPPTAEGLIVPAKVNCVGKGADLSKLGYHSTGATPVVIKHLQGSYLWEKVRVQGGAYGGSCSFDRRSGLFSFGSYRDPNLLGTLDVYDRAAAYLASAKISEAELTRSIIGVIGDLDDHMLPDMKGFVSLGRYLAGDTDEALQRWREEALSTRLAAFAEFGEALKAVAEKGRVVVLGSEPAISAANAERPGFLAVTKVL